MKRAQRLSVWPLATRSAIFVPLPRRYAIRAASSGRRMAKFDNTRVTTGATSTSWRLRSIAVTTASATYSGVVVPNPGGGFAPLSWNIPASRTKPGVTSDTPIPRFHMSSRNPRAKPRSPNFVAE